jgi:hypothetical protein
MAWWIIGTAHLTGFIGWDSPVCAAFYDYEKVVIK